MTERIPPHNLSAEQSLLGAMMIDNKVIYPIISEIGEDYFYNRSHQQIFSAIKSLFKSRQAVDLVTVSDHFERMKQEDQPCDFAYLAELSKNSLSVNFQSYIKIVSDTYNARQIIAACCNGMEQCYQSKDYEGARKSVYDGLEQCFKNNPGDNSIAGGEDLCNSLIDELDRINKSGGVTGMTTGNRHIDEATGGLQPGDYVGLSARSGGGKTTVALNILAHYTKMNRRSLMFSMEMKRQRVMMKIISDMASVPFSALKKAELDDLQWGRVSNEFRFLKDSKLHVDDSSGMRIDDIERKAKWLKSKYGELDLIVVDYIQRLKIDSNSMYQELTTASNRLKDLFMSLGCAGIVLAQLKKNSVGFPKGADLRETGAIENDSDLLIFLHTNSENLKPHKGMQTAMSLDKVRYGETGVKMLENQLDFQRFMPVDGEYKEDDDSFK